MNLFRYPKTAIRSLFAMHNIIKCLSLALVIYSPLSLSADPPGKFWWSNVPPVNTTTHYSGSQELCDLFYQYIKPSLINYGYSNFVPTCLLGPITNTTRVSLSVNYININGETGNNTYEAGWGYNLTCTSLQVADPSTGYCINPVAAKNEPDLALCASSPYPISYSSGNKVLRETDYSGLGLAALSFTRTYNSSSAVNFDRQGMKWRNGYSRSISLINNVAYTYRAGGKIYSFNHVASNWLPAADITDKLIELKDGGGVRIGWTYTVDATGEVETYDATGKLLYIADRAGLTQALTYSCKVVSAICPVITPATVAATAGLLIAVADPVGRSLSFTYDSKNRIATMTNPAGGVYTYAYSADGNNNLVSVTYPDGKVKTYHYENTTFSNALTGISDENGSRYMTYTYDSNGRAIDEISPTFATNVNHYGLSYTPGVSTIVTDPLGSVRTYNFTTILGVVKSTGQSQPAGTGCAASASAITYDAHGNVDTRIDFNGNQTTYSYNLARNLETRRIEGLTSTGTATAATRTITTTWHTSWRLPIVTSEYAGDTATGTPVRITTKVYDDKGNITSYTEEDPIRGLSRTTTVTYTYSTVVPGLVLEKWVDGPLPGNIDLTRYYYYPHDATCADSAAEPIIDPVTLTSPPNYGCRGQLERVIDKTGLTTSYDRYNHHGKIELWTDANGVYNTYSYDLRQRLTRITVENEETAFTYDDAGLLKKTTFPDGSELNYIYDNAHRLTEISNSLGDRVVYTLDNSGNRINEQMFNSSGMLTKSIARQFDALNRVQSVTGE